MAEAVPGGVRIAPTLDAPLGAGTVVFCATLALAWQALGKAAGCHPPCLEGDPPLAAALAAERVGPDDLDPRAYVARAAIGDRGLRATREAIQATFGSDADTSLLPESMRSSEMIAYASLRKNLFFETPFAQGQEQGMAFAGGTRVRYFFLGDSDDALRDSRAKQVTVHHHRSDDDFVLELSTRDTEERLLVARVATPSTLGETVKQVLEHAGRPPSMLQRLRGERRVRSDEPLEIPLVDLHARDRFESLAGRQILTTDWVVAEAVQDITFALDETGARLKSEAAILVARGGRGPRRRFICNGPFLIVLLRRGRTTPYFAAWLGGVEALSPLTPTTR